MTDNKTLTAREHDLLTAIGKCRANDGNSLKHDLLVLGNGTDVYHDGDIERMTKRILRKVMLIATQERKHSTMVSLENWLEREQSSWKRDEVGQ